MALTGLLCLMMIIFNNCSPGFQILDPATVDVASLSAQCRQKIQNDAVLPEFDADLVCEDFRHYQCDQRSFRPGLTSGSQMEHVCLVLAGVGQTCLDVKTFRFDTTPNRDVAEATDFHEGGSYNRDEVVCFHDQIKSQNVPLIEGEGTSVAEALEKTIQSCRNGSHP